MLGQGGNEAPCPFILLNPLLGAYRRFRYRDARCVSFNTTNLAFFTGKYTSHRLRQILPQNAAIGGAGSFCLLFKSLERVLGELGLRKAQQQSNFKRVKAFCPVLKEFLVGLAILLRSAPFLDGFKHCRPPWGYLRLMLPQLRCRYATRT